MWGAVVAGLVVTGLLVDHFWSINTNFPEGRPIAATATPARRILRIYSSLHGPAADGARLAFERAGGRAGYFELVAEPIAPTINATREASADESAVIYLGEVDNARVRFCVRPGSQGSPRV